MQITVTLSLLVAVCYAASKNKEKTKTDKRDLLEGNYGERTYLKNVLRSVHGIDYSDDEDALSGRSSHGYSSTPRIAKISDVLSDEGSHYSSISDHLYSPVSAYQSRLSSPSFDQNTELGLSETEPKPKSNKKHKKPKSPPKRTNPPYEPKPLQFDNLASFASYQPELSQFRNLYQEPTYDRGLFSPKFLAQPSFARPIRPSIPQYNFQAFQQPQVYPQQRLEIPREYQPLQYIQQPVPQVLPSLSYAQRAQQAIPGLTYSQGARQVLPGLTYPQVAPKALPGLTYPQFQQAIANPAIAQPTQQALIYSNGAQQIIPAFNPITPQVIPAASYPQGVQQVLPGQLYPQKAQQLVPNVAYAQAPQQPGVVYAQQPTARPVQQQPLNVVQQQPAPQQQILTQAQQNQGAVSYASFSQSLPPYAQPQVQPQQQEQVSLTQQVQPQTYLLPVRPDLSGAAQPLQILVPDSQPQPQQISASQPTPQPEEEQVVTILPAKPKSNDQGAHAENQQHQSSNVEPTTQTATSQAIAYSSTTQAPLTVSTLASLVPSRYQQALQQAGSQTTADKGQTYLQQVPQGYSENVAYQQPGDIAPTLPSVQYFGNFAESLFGNYQ